jgi:hypothetical protein
MVDGGYYNGDVLFENLELIRTVESRGGSTAAPLDLLRGQAASDEIPLLEPASPAGLRRLRDSAEDGDLAGYPTAGFGGGPTPATGSSCRLGAGRHLRGGAGPTPGRRHERLSGYLLATRSGLDTRARGLLLVGPGAT